MNDLAHFFVAHPVVGCALGYLAAVLLFFAFTVWRTPVSPDNEDDGHGN